MAAAAMTKMAITKIRLPQSFGLAQIGGRPPLVRLRSGDQGSARNRIRRGVFTSVADLESAIVDYLENHNADPKPFIWTKSAGQILEKVARTKQALESQL